VVRLPQSAPIAVTVVPLSEFENVALSVTALDSEAAPAPNVERPSEDQATG